MRPWTAVQRVVTIRGGLPRLVRDAGPARARPGQHHAGDGGARAARGDRRTRRTRRCCRCSPATTTSPSPARQLLAGRSTTVLEARRPGVTGAGCGRRPVLARLRDRAWCCDATSTTSPVRWSGPRPSTCSTSALRRPSATASGRPSTTSTSRGSGRCEAQGWPVQRELVRRASTCSTRGCTTRSLQLSYSDGLSTVSVFVQPGEMDARADRHGPSRRRRRHRVGHRRQPGAAGVVGRRPHLDVALGRTRDRGDRRRCWRSRTRPASPTTAPPPGSGAAWPSWAGG